MPEDHAAIQDSEPGPCGGVRPVGGLVTQLQVAALVNVSWENTRPTPGATYSLTLLDLNGSLLVPYSANGGDLGGISGALSGSGSSALQRWQLIQLPSLPCANCTLRLVEELPGGAPTNVSNPPELWSCADVNITRGLDACSNLCQGWGTCAVQPAGLGAFECQCDAGLSLLMGPAAAASAPACDAVSGTYGQVHDACVRDSDCGTNGQCQPRTQSQPRHCFCKAGWRGPLCAQRTLLSLDRQLDLRAWEVQYPIKLRAPGVAMYARIVGPPQAQLIEVALAAVTSSYVSVGWRPASLDQAAALAPLLPLPATLVRESPLAALYQNSSLIYDAGAAPVPPAPDLEALLLGLTPDVTVAAANTTANVTTDVTGGPGARRLLQVGPTTLSGFNTSSPVIPSNGTLPPSWLCDVTVCYANGEYFKVEDLSMGASYSAPLPDGAVGGTDDIVDAIGRAAGGLVYCKFRRPLVSGNLAGDQSVTLREDQTVVWARGQSAAQAANASGGVLDTAALAQLYAPTDMLYHGTANRGVFGNLNLILGRPLGAVPPGLCRPSPLPLFECTFRINARLRLHWRVVGTSLALALEFPASAGWVALGWSASGHMEGAIAVVGMQQQQQQQGEPSAGAPVGLYELTAKSVEGVQPSAAFPIFAAALTVAGRDTAILSFSRPTVVGPEGASIVAGHASRLVWALAEDDTPQLRYHRVQNRGSFSLDFSSGEGTTDRNPAGQSKFDPPFRLHRYFVRTLVAEIGSVSFYVLAPLYRFHHLLIRFGLSNPDWYGIHGWLMAIAMGALLPLGVIFVRASRGAKSMQGEGESWYFEGAHVAFQLLGSAAVVAGFTVAFLTFLGGPGRAVHTLHGIVGLAVGGVLLGQMGLGWLPFLDYSPAVERMNRLLHAGVGIAVLAAGNWAVLLGLFRYAALTGTRIQPLIIGQGATLAVMAALWALAGLLSCCGRHRPGAPPVRPASPRSRPWVPSELHGPFKQEGDVAALEYAHPLALSRGGSQRFLLSDDDLFELKDARGARAYSPPHRMERLAPGPIGDSVSRRSGRGGGEASLEQSRSFRGWISP